MVIIQWTYSLFHLNYLLTFFQILNSDSLIYNLELFSTRINIIILLFLIHFIIKVYSIFYFLFLLIILYTLSNSCILIYHDFKNTYLLFLKDNKEHLILVLYIKLFFIFLNLCCGTLLVHIMLFFRYSIK